MEYALTMVRWAALVIYIRNKIWLQTSILCRHSVFLILSFTIMNPVWNNFCFMSHCWCFCHLLIFLLPLPRIIGLDWYNVFLFSLWHFPPARTMQKCETDYGFDWKRKYVFLLLWLYEARFEWGLTLSKLGLTSREEHNFSDTVLSLNTVI